MRGAEGGEGGSFASEWRYTEPLPISPSALRGLIPGGGRRWGSPWRIGGLLR